MSQSDPTTQATQSCEIVNPADTAAPGGGLDPEKTVLADHCNPSLGPALEKWNQPKVNRNRYLATVFGLTIMGLNDACLGALIPYVRSHSLSVLVGAYPSQHGRHIDTQTDRETEREREREKCIPDDNKLQSYRLNLPSPLTNHIPGALHVC